MILIYQLKKKVKDEKMQGANKQKDAKTFISIFLSLIKQSTAIAIRKVRYTKNENK